MLKLGLFEESLCLLEENWVGHLNTIFATWGGNLNKPIFKSSNAFGEITWWCCPGEGGGS